MQINLQKIFILGFMTFLIHMLQYGVPHTRDPNTGFGEEDSTLYRPPPGDSHLL